MPRIRATKRQSVWILFIEVSGAAPNGEAMNAFVNVAVPAEGRVQALVSAANALERAGFSIVNVESASEFKRLPFHDRRKPLMKVLVARARRTQQAQLGKFYSWPEGSHED